MIAPEPYPIDWSTPEGRKLAVRFAKMAAKGGMTTRDVQSLLGTTIVRGFPWRELEASHRIYPEVQAARLDGIVFAECRADHGWKLEHCIIDHCVFEHVDTDLGVTHCEIRDCHFRHAQLRSSSLGSQYHVDRPWTRSTLWERVRFESCDLRDCSLGVATWRDVSVVHCKLQRFDTECAWIERLQIVGKCHELMVRDQLRYCPDGERVLPVPPPEIDLTQAQVRWMGVYGFADLSRVQMPSDGHAVKYKNWQSARDIALERRRHSADPAVSQAWDKFLSVYLARSDPSWCVLDKPMVQKSFAPIADELFVAFRPLEAP